MSIFILVFGTVIGVSNLLSSNSVVKRYDLGKNKIQIILGYLCAGWMFSWALFEGLFPLISGK